MLTLRMLHRDFTLPSAQSPIPWTVEALEWSAQGGPDLLDVRGETASEPDALDVLNWLRRPIEVWDEDFMQPMWWGYVNAVEVQVGVVTVGVSLDAMANMVSVVYDDTLTTAAALAADSITQYGAKERREEVHDGPESLALALRDAMLAQRAWPVPTLEISDDPVSLPRVTLHARGWWHTLTWRYYANADTSSVDTTTQLTTILATVAPFLGSVVADPSGIATSAARDGDRTAAEIVTDLLTAGSTTATRRLASVTPDRRVVVVDEPDRGDVSLYLRRDGSMRDAFHVPVARTTPPVGRWIAVVDTLPACVVRGGVDPRIQFVERANYRASRDRWRLEPRGMADVWDLAGG